MKITSTIQIITLSGCFVIMDFLCSSHSEVSHVILVTLLTNLQISVSVHLSNSFRRYSTFSVQTINILGNNVLEVAFIHKFNQSHMTSSWSSIRYLGFEILIIIALTWGKFSSLKCFLNICCLFPASWTSW